MIFEWLGSLKRMHPMTCVARVIAVFFLAGCVGTNSEANRAAETIRAPRQLEVIKDPNPYYPYVSQKAKETGEVILHFHIDSGGIAQEPFEVEEPHTAAARRLTEAAEKMFRHSRYEVGERYKHDVSASVIFEIVPCGKIQQTSESDYHYRLCIEPLQIMPSPTPGASHL